MNLAGNQGELLANESVEAVRKIVDSTPPPPGVKAYVTGAAALAADLHDSGDKSMVKITVTTVAVILIMLLFVYRSPITVFCCCSRSVSNCRAARGAVALLGHSGAHRTLTFAVSLLTSLAIAAGTDYGIFIIGRYQEARQAGEDQRNGLLHDVPGDGARHPGLRFDDRRGDVLPAASRGCPTFRPWASLAR